MFGRELKKCFVLSVVNHEFLKVILGKCLVHRPLPIFWVILALKTALELLVELFLCDDCIVLE